MASGDPVVKIIQVMIPAANSALLGQRAGGSTPAESFPVYEFGITADQYLDFLCQLSNYDGGGLTFTLPWSSGGSATTGVVRWGVAIRRIADDAEDVDVSHSYDYNDIDDTAANVNGELSYATVTFTNGADMDSWADGELAVVRVRRDQDHGNDSLAATAQLWGLFGRET